MNREDTEFLEELKRSVNLLYPGNIGEQFYNSLSDLLRGIRQHLTTRGNFMPISEIFRRLAERDIFFAYWWNN